MHPNGLAIYLKFDTEISWIMTHHLNKNVHFEKSDHVPLRGDLALSPIATAWSMTSRQHLKLWYCTIVKLVEKFSNAFIDSSLCES